MRRIETGAEIELGVGYEFVKEEEESINEKGADEGEMGIL